MKNVIINEIKSLVLMQSHQCYNNIIENNNEIEIIKAKYGGSSITEVRELYSIHMLLNEHKEYLDVVSTAHKITVVFK